MQPGIILTVLQDGKLARIEHDGGCITVDRDEMFELLEQLNAALATKNTNEN